MGVCEGSPSPVMLVILLHLYVTYYFFPEPPGAIMVPSGTWAKALLRSSCKAPAIAQKACSPHRRTLTAYTNAAPPGLASSRVFLLAQC